MSEPPLDPIELLDAVTRLITAVRSEREDKLAQVLREPIDYFMESERKRDAKEELREQGARSPPTIYDVQGYLAICKQLELDPRDPATKDVLRSLRL